MSEAASNSSLIDRVRNYLWYSGLRVPWLTGYNVGGAALLVFFFALTSQGHDLLRIAAERGLGLDDKGLLWNGLLLLGTLAASVIFWYTSRLLLGRHYPGYPLPSPYANPGKRWWPRIVGVAVPAAIGLTFRDIAKDANGPADLLAWVYLGMAVLLLLAYVLRRLLFGIDRDYMIGELPDELPPDDRRRGWYLLLTSFALLLLFMLLPVHLPQWLGAPAIAVLGVSGVCLFGTAILTYLPMSRGAPAATLTALLLALLFGLWNHNHPIRVAASDDIPTIERVTPAERFSAWRGNRPGEQPVVFVTASGGGIRAAYWTASTLAFVEQQLGAAFSDRLFAISGVSGGSLGGATYIALKRAQLDAGGTESLLGPAREVLGHDFMSPVLAGMLFPDLAQRFFPLPVLLADRQRFLELSWEAAFDGRAGDLFHGPFQALYAGPNAERLPSLLLNTTVVETGQRAIVSDLKVGMLPDVLDLLDPRYQLGAIRTSAAAGASARFTYVSPAGRVDIKHAKHLRLVDGGYFENSGAATMVDLLAELGGGALKSPGFRPVLLVIRNNVTASPLCRRDLDEEKVDLTPYEGPTGDDFNANVSEVVSPMLALLHTRDAREREAEVKAAREVDAMGGAVVEVPLAAVLQVRFRELIQASQADLGTDAANRPLSVDTVKAAIGADTVQQVKRQYAEPPLGWSLSEEVRRGMDETLDRELGGLKKQFGYLATALDGGQVPACDPR